MNANDSYVNDGLNLSSTNHSRGLPVPNAIPHQIPTQEEVYETVGGLERATSQNHESGKFSRS